MTPSAWDDDESLLADLAAALRDAAPLHDAVRDRGRAAYAWRTVDDELQLASLIFDSELEEAGPVRDDTGGPRILVFDADGISVELEVSPDRIAGQILPPAAGRIVVESQDQPDSTFSVDADDLGFFVLPGLIPGLRRLRCDTQDARLVTDWVRF